MRGDTGDVPGNPGLEGGVGLVRVVLLNESLDRQACIDHHGPVHAQLSISASLTFVSRPAYRVRLLRSRPLAIRQPTRGSAQKQVWVLASSPRLRRSLHTVARTGPEPVD